MVITCCAPNCNHTRQRDGCVNFQFPWDIEIRREWMRRIGLVGELKTWHRICSCHFRDRNKENGPDIVKRDTRKRSIIHDNATMGVTQRKTGARDTKSRSSTSSAEESEKMRISMDYGAVSSTSSAEESEEIRILLEYDAVPCRLSTEESGDINMSLNYGVAPSQRTATSRDSSIIAEAELSLMRAKLKRKDEIIRTLRHRFSYEEICVSNKLVLKFTGIPSHKLFEALYKLINGVEVQYYLQWKVDELSKKDQLLMTLMKLRLNSPQLDLAHRFNVSEATVTNVVVTFIHVVHKILFKTLMKDIPYRHQNLTCLPNCASTFTNCRIILDTTEVFCVVPRESMKNQRLTYRSYKHRNTFKVLVGVAPNGVITYLSNLYPGSTSDTVIVKHCGIVKQFVPGDLILADKGFLIKDILPNEVHLNVPPFFSTSQFTKQHVERTRCIARARIHVDRAIKRMKTYRILSFIPNNLFHYSTIIVQTVGSLTNLQYHLIREIEDFYEDVN